MYNQLQEAWKLLWGWESIATIDKEGAIKLKYITKIVGVERRRVSFKIIIFIKKIKV